MPTLDALRAGLPTSRHAAMTFDMLVDLLGDQAVVSTANDRTRLALYRRDTLDSGLIVPWMVAQINLRGRIGIVSQTFNLHTGEVAPPTEPVPGKAYKLRGLGPTELRLYDGPAYVSVLYGNEGTVVEGSLNDLVPSRLDELLPALASKRAQAAELVASCVASIDPGRHGPGRVRVPVPVPGGPEVTWMVGLHAARRALFAGQVPPDARYLVVDGVSGRALGAGATLAEATASFERQLAVKPPSYADRRVSSWDDDYDDEGNLIQAGEGRVPDDPHPWTKDDDEDAPAPFKVQFEGPSDVVPLGGGFLRMTGPKADGELPELHADSVPRVVIPLAGSPPVPPPLGRWERTIGARGATGHVARRVAPEGFLQIGERLAWRVDPRTLEDQLDEADAGNERGDRLLAGSPTRPFLRYRTRGYRWMEASPDAPAGFREVFGSSGPHYEGLDLDGDVEPELVRRHVKIPRDPG